MGKLGKGRAKKMVESGFELLPKEIQEKTLSLLPLVDRIRLRRVCRGWDALLRSRHAWVGFKRLTFCGSSVSSNRGGLDAAAFRSRKGRPLIARSEADAALALVAAVPRRCLKALELRSLGPGFLLSASFVDGLRGVLEARRVRLSALTLADLLADGDGEKLLLKALGRLFRSQPRLKFLAYGPIEALSRRPYSLSSEPLSARPLRKLPPGLKHLCICETHLGSEEDPIAELEPILEQIGEHLDALWLSHAGLNELENRAIIARLLKAHAPQLSLSRGGKLGFTAKWEATEFLEPAQANSALQSPDFWIDERWSFTMDVLSSEGAKEDGNDSEQGEEVGRSSDEADSDGSESIGSLDDFLAADDEGNSSDSNSSEGEDEIDLEAESPVQSLRKRRRAILESSPELQSPVSESPRRPKPRRRRLNSDEDD